MLTGLVTTTDMGSKLVGYFDKYAPTYPRQTLEESVNGTLKVVQEATKEDHTKYVLSTS